MRVMGRLIASALTSSCASGCKAAACGRESELSSDSIGVRWGEAERLGVMEPRWAKSGGDDGRTGGGAEVVDAANPLGVTCGCPGTKGYYPPNHGLASYALCMWRMSIVLMISNGIWRALGLRRHHVGTVEGAIHMLWKEWGTVCAKGVIGQE